MRDPGIPPWHPLYLHRKRQETKLQNINKSPKDYQNRCQAGNKSTLSQASVLGEFEIRKKTPRSLSLCLRHVPASGRLEGRVPPTRVSAVVCRCFCRFGCRKAGCWWAKIKMDPQRCQKRPTLNQKGAKSDQHWANRLPTWAQQLVQNQALEHSTFYLFLHWVFRKNCEKTVTAHL